MGLRNDIQIPPELVLLGKTLLNLEPMCRRLDPDMDPVATMKDAAVRLLEEQIRRDISNERLMALLLELRSLLYDVPLSLRPRTLRGLPNSDGKALRLMTVPCGLRPEEQWCYLLPGAGYLIFKLAVSFGWE